MSERSSALAILAATLADCRALLAAGDKEVPGGEALIDEILAGLEDAGGEMGAGAGELAEWLQGFAGPDAEGRERLADVVTLIVRDLAEGDGPPPGAGAADLWNELVILTDRLFGSGVAPLGRLPFVSERLLELLMEESGGAERQGRPRRGGGSLPREPCGEPQAAGRRRDCGRLPGRYDRTGRCTSTTSPARTSRPHVDSHDYEVGVPSDP